MYIVFDMCPYDGSTTLAVSSGKNIVPFSFCVNLASCIWRNGFASLGKEGFILGKN
jgi:hypothetical protein